MIPTKPPERRRSFVNSKDELNHLNDRIRYYVHTGKLKTPPAKRCLRRFATLLRRLGPDDGSIVLQEHWALLYETRGDLARAATHREREIALVERLFAIGGPIECPNPAYSINNAFLAREMRVLHGHYLAQGRSRKANTLLRRIAELESS